MGLRNTVRAFLEARMMNIILEDPSLRTANEMTVLTWLQQTLGQREKYMYDSALADQQNWAHNTCGYQIDQDIAKAFNINYIPCVGSVVANNAPHGFVFPGGGLEAGVHATAERAQSNRVVQDGDTEPSVQEAARPAGNEAEVAGRPAARITMHGRQQPGRLRGVLVDSRPGWRRSEDDHSRETGGLHFQRGSNQCRRHALRDARRHRRRYLTVNANNGIATFNNVSFNTQRAYNVTATVGSVKSSVHIVNASTGCGGCTTSGFAVFQGTNSNLAAILGSAGAILGLAPAIFATLVATIQPLRFAIFPNQKSWKHAQAKETQRAE